MSTCFSKKIGLYPFFLSLLPLRIYLKHSWGDATRLNKANRILYLSSIDLFTIWSILSSFKSNKISSSSLLIRYSISFTSFSLIRSPYIEKPPAKYLVIVVFSKKRNFIIKKFNHIIKNQSIV